MIRLTVDNANPFNAGWLACHVGLPRDCLKLEDFQLRRLPPWDGASNDLVLFQEGYDMRAETGDMNDPHDISGHGNSHIAFLVESTNPGDVTFVRHRPRIEVVP